MQCILDWSGLRLSITDFSLVSNPCTTDMADSMVQKRDEMKFFLERSYSRPLSWRVFLFGQLVIVYPCDSEQKPHFLAVLVFCSVVIDQIWRLAVECRTGFTWDASFFLLLLSAIFFSFVRFHRPKDAWDTFALAGVLILSWAAPFTPNPADLDENADW